MRPFEEFLERALREFEQQLGHESLAERVREHRLRGARDFAIYLLGKPMNNVAPPRTKS